MNILVGHIKQDRVPLLLAFSQWYITTVLQIDRLFFTYDNETKYYLLVKVLYLIFLLVAWKYGFFVYREIKQDNPIYTRGLKVFCVYFFIMLILMLVLWPGTWAWDDLVVLNSISQYHSFHPWQHVLTGIYQDVLLQILPFPGGIIFLQNVIVTLCVSFSVVKLENTFHIVELKCGMVDIFLKIIPFLLPPVLMYQFSGYRMGLYVYLELAVLVILICACKENKEWNWKYLILFSVLTVIVSTWRTEAFLYIPVSCILVLMINKKVISRDKKITCIILLMIGFIGLNRFQNLQLGNSNYKIISLMCPCAELVRVADYQRDAEELAAIDKVMDLKVVYANSTYTGEALYWSTSCVRNYTQEDYENFLKAFIRLSIKYPKTVIEERWGIFWAGSGITGKTINNVELAATLFIPDNGNSAAAIALSKGWIANTPVLKGARENVIYLFGGAGIGIIKRLVWNAVIPEIILIYEWVKLLVRKKWYLWFICSTVLVKLLIVILTQPAKWMMYVLSFYFLGYVLLVYELWIYYSKAKELEKNA